MVRLNPFNKGVWLEGLFLKVNLLLLTLLILGGSFASASSEPEELWNKTYGGSDDDYAEAVQQTSDGYIIAGFTESYGAGNGDAWLIKTDSDGNEVWNKTYGGPEYDRAYSVQETPDGYVVAGHKSSSGDFEAWLIKTDSLGNEQWNKTFGGSINAYSVQQISDGYVVAGHILYPSPHGPFDEAWLAKTDSDGNEVWNKTYGGGPEYDEALSIQQIPDGYIIAGWTCSYGPEGNAWLIKTDSSGNEQWNKTYGVSGDDIARSVQKTPEGYIIVGEISYGTSADSVWLIKTNSSGNEVWNKTFGVTLSTDEGHSVVQTSGGYVVAGYTTNYGAGGGDAWLIKTDVNGNEQWSKTFGGPDKDKAHSVLQTSDDFIIAGFTGSYGAGNSDAWLIKTGSKDIEVSPTPEESTESKASPGFETVLAIAGLLTAIYFREPRK